VSSLAANFLLLAWLAVSILLPGIAICHRWTRLRGLELIAYGAAAGVVLQACLGLFLTVTRAARVPVVLLSGLATLAAFVYLWRAGGVRERFADLSRSARATLAIWGLFAATCVALTHLEVRLPPNLPDGIYIFKGPTVNVKMQYLVSLPADNYFPYVVAEYFLRRISFRTERPILPGNEVSNRTILMSLVALPYRAALAMPPRAKKPLNKFTYVNQQWPAVEQLHSERSYRQLLVVGIFLNSLVLLGLLAFFRDAAADPVLLPSAALLYLTNSYMLSQTIFIWPKALAGFFLLLAWHSARRGHHPAVVGACAGLAYHSHPYAGLFAAGLGLFYLSQTWRDRNALRPAALFAATFLLVIAPWFLWTRLFLNLSSDMLWQNLAGAGTDAALSTPLNFIWIRLWNLFHLLTPTLFAVYPFDVREIAERALVSLPGAVGIFLIFPAIRESMDRMTPRGLFWFGLALPALLIALIFSYPSLLVLHGYQVIVGLLIFCGLTKLRRRLSPAGYWSLAILQLICNLALLGMRGFVSGVHLP